jgi:toxin-antitoxin system PIN domain toxin
VILLDTNVLVAASRNDHPLHGEVRAWFDGLLAGDAHFGVPGAVWASFVRIVTNRRIFPVPTPLREAFDFSRAVREQPGYEPVSPGPNHLDLFERTCLEAEAGGDLVPDAYLAALAIEQGGELVSLDRDFARFPGLRWRRPGVPATGG